MQNNEVFTGVIGDPRQDERVLNGWKIDEVLPGDAPVNWQPKQMAQLVQYPVWNQLGTSACVAFSKAKQISIKIYEMTGVWIDFSPASIYQLRSNSGGGMYPPNANDIVNTRGVTLEALMKSQNLSEAQINQVKRTKVADLFARAIAEAVVRYLYVPVDIDRIAQAIEAKRAVSLLIFGTEEEYARLRPVILNPNLTYEQAGVKHEVVAVDYFLDQNGNKVLYINDSAHFGGIPVREFTKDFLEKRCIMADVIDVFTFEPGEDPGTRPSYDGVTIISAQKCLLYEGLFPVGVPFVENLGPITKEAINKFQIKYGLSATGTGTLGPLTKTKLKQLYP